MTKTTTNASVNRSLFMSLFIITALFLLPSFSEGDQNIIDERMRIIHPIIESRDTRSLLSVIKDNPLFKGYDKERLLGLAAMYGHTEAVTLLLKAGANVNIQTKGGNTPLHQAAWDGYTVTRNLTRYLCF